MAKINARGAHQVGPTFYTERTRPGDAHDVERIYYEAWRLRSDGQVQHRIISTRPAAADSIGHSTKHSSGYANHVNLSKKALALPQAELLDKFRALLNRAGHTIVKEK